MEQDKKSEVGEMQTTFVKPSVARRLRIARSMGRCESIVITDPETSESKAFPMEREDAVPVAIAILSGGRLSSDLEEMAQALFETLSTTSFEEDRIDQALIQLRALVLLREKRVREADERKRASEKQMKDAYTLYLLAQPEGAEVLESVEEFVRSNEGAVWGNKLAWLRMLDGPGL
jgi:hypothetical protein